MKWRSNLMHARLHTFAYAPNHCGFAVDLSIALVQRPERLPGAGSFRGVRQRQNIRSRPPHTTKGSPIKTISKEGHGIASV